MNHIRRLIAALTILAVALAARAQQASGTGITQTSPGFDLTPPTPNAAVPLQMLNYLGNIENIHPKVLYFADGWRGHRYWMAYTPYPLGAVDAENPCVAVSDDGYEWDAPAGVANPLAGTPWQGYNSDTHLLYDPGEDRLEVWWRPVDSSGPRIRDAFMRVVSYDGVTWSEPQTVLEYGDPGMCRLSPAVAIVDDRYYMVYSDCVSLMYMWGDRTAGGGIAWEEPQQLPLDRTYRRLAFWHHDFIVDDDGTVEMVICAFAPREGGSSNAADLYYVTYDIASPDDISVPEMILPRSADPAAIDSRSIYRSSIVRVDDGYRIYYSSIDSDWHRYMSVTEGAAIHALRGLDIADDVPRRRIVAEAHTATWDPRSAAVADALRRLATERPDDFIGIDIHTDDELWCDTYTDMAEQYFGGAPATLVCRTMLTDGSYAALARACDLLAAPAHIAVEADAHYTNRLKSAVRASADVTFSRDVDDVDYRVAFVLVEDAVEAIMASDEADNEEDAEAASLYGVARYVTDWRGDAESAMHAARAGDVVHYERVIPLKDTDINFGSFDRLGIVALLIDNTRGHRTVCTGATTPIRDVITTGVEDVADSDPDAPVEYYNLRGMRVAGPAAGSVYIRRHGERAAGVIF